MLQSEIQQQLDIQLLTVIPWIYRYGSETVWVTMVTFLLKLYCDRLLSVYIRYMYTYLSCLLQFLYVEETLNIENCKNLSKVPIFLVKS